jgi:hypothetical protein
MGARNAGNPHVACDVEGAGDVVFRLEDRLEYELERALHHSVTDRWNREDTDLPPSFGIS